MTMTALSCVMVGAYAAKPTFWALASSVISNRAAVVGLATINAVSMLVGGGLMVSVYGWVKLSTGSFAFAMLPFAGLVVISLAALLFVNRGTSSEKGSVPVETAKA